jgi:general stress protein 26
MATPSEIEQKFWKALKSDMTVMLGLPGKDGGKAQPMTAQIGKREGRGPIWFFSARDVDLVEAMGPAAPAELLFVSKGHDLFASVEGRLVPDDDPARIDELWSPFAAAWYEEGKDDPKLRLIRFDPGSAQIWLNGNSLFAGVKMLLGSDPKKDYQDKVAQIEMSA